MEEIILNLINDDFYALWEVRYVVMQEYKDASHEKIIESLSRLVKDNLVSCFIVDDLSSKIKNEADRDYFLDLMNVEENWRVPSENSEKILLITSKIFR